MPDNPVQSAVARLAETQRKDRKRNPKVIAEARNALVAAKTQRAIEQALNPEPLRKADRVRLARLLREG
jgi:serine phosphatase RsbU (regulator of sigma subunit)